ncbi:MAG: capsule assembly Wzi family protein, partial [Leeuwenhoekiella sp.]
FNNFLKIFVGESGGGDSYVGEQTNALGNHLGSYHLTYDLKKPDYSLKIYYQSIFEDRSGRELNNFPDGVWGVMLKPKNGNLIKGILYEYAQTISQSGRHTFSGGDRYFYNGIYKTGWTYEGRTIGIPFIIPNTTRDGIAINRSIVHHLGFTGDVGFINYLFKISYVKNLGRYGFPINPAEKAIYTMGQFNYSSFLGDLQLTLGLDNSNYKNATFGVGMGYHYKFN